MKKKLIVLLVSILTISGIGFGVFAATSWSSAGFSTVKKGNTTTGYTFFVQRICEGNYVSCTIDGVWGTQTTNAVKAMQAQCGITSDGIVGPTSWNAFNSWTVWGQDASFNEYWAGTSGSPFDYNQVLLCERTTTGQWYTWTQHDAALYQFK